ncbi:MAG: TIGR03087 family PEP-CTERM/XrtA system glycosyltransferase [Candidatus Solibacter usitatus]|nr:TIGR03087 family PEP-CTERM/XrtA system glycosyltransferase [Candidatus Solibacter usitatus]
MELLYLSHCVPSPPNKGEKIRSYHELTALAARHRVHLGCFAREPAELEEARKLIDRCASVYVAPLFPFSLHAARAGVRFLAGSSLNGAFYSSGGMKRDIAALMASVPVRGAVAYTAVMAPYVPEGVPFVLDMTDVDSEKWLQYAERRRPSLPYSTEARRVRAMEVEQARRARLTLLTTKPEEELFRSFAGEVATAAMENGVDLEYFDPAVARVEPSLAGREYLLFAGSMDYYPNVEAVCGFARKVFPALRAAHRGLEFVVVGRKPDARVFALAGLEGVTIAGTVDDVRPYYSGARAVVAPLGIARGIQNKVLEALAMGKPVLASKEVCRTFGKQLPPGVAECGTAEEHEAGLKMEWAPGGIRAGAQARFRWENVLKPLVAAVEGLGAAR